MAWACLLLPAALALASGSIAAPVPTVGPPQRDPAIPASCTVHGSADAEILCRGPVQVVVMLVEDPSGALRVQ